jgi:cellulose synthase/poly-beta-1,6-N-acetylglucosamine synthase-like glycosyltransferase
MEKLWTIFFLLDEFLFFFVEIIYTIVPNLNLVIIQIIEKKNPPPKKRGEEGDS